MLIHVVKPGDTVYSIALEYGIPMSQLILDNGLETSSRLAVGRRWWFNFQPRPTRSIPEKPWPPSPRPISSHCASSTATIPYSAVSRRSILARPWCSPTTARRRHPLRQRLRLSLYRPGAAPIHRPLSHLSDPLYLWLYPDGTLVELDDEPLAAARQGGAAPLMHLSTLTEEGGFSNELAHLASLSPRYRIRWLTIWRPCWCKRATGGWVCGF